MKQRLIRILAAGVLLACGYFIKTAPEWLSTTLFTTGYILVGADIIYNALRNLFKGEIFDENLLMSIATIGAFIIGELPEAVFVMLFYQVGEFFGDLAQDRSRRSVTALMALRPDHASVLINGEYVKLDPAEVKVGETLLIKPGERIPLDAKVIEGASTLDTSALTGEPVPRSVKEGDELLSGCINLTGVLTAQVTKPLNESTVGRILKLMEESAAKKSSQENFITSFARWYTPIVVALAALLAFVPPLIIGWDTFNAWAYRALSFLVVSCPCALVVSVPLTFFCGMGGAARRGILVKGGNYLEALAKADNVVVFDKTGTLTKGMFSVLDVNANGMSKTELLDIAAHAEALSNHPIAISLRSTINIDPSRVTDAHELPGAGVSALVDGRRVFAGSPRLMRENGLVPHESGAVHIAVDGAYAGSITIGDEIKPDAKTAIVQLKALGVEKTVMLTGDRRETAQNVSEALGLDDFHAELLPADKVTWLEAMLKARNGSILFVGDGVNDSPVLARADVGVAMGALGQDAAIEAADVVLMTDEVSKLPLSIRIARKTLVIARENIALALTIKIAVLILSATGLAKTGLGGVRGRRYAGDRRLQCAACTGRKETVTPDG
jgi:Cd2+/Zn2+-exporting ATPase